MKNKNTIRVLVLLGILAWPGVETYRYWVAQQQLEESITQQRSVNERLAYLQSIQVPVPPEASSATVPVKGEPATGSEDSGI